MLGRLGHTDRRRTWHTIAIRSTSPAFERTSKRRKGYPSETNVKRGLRFVHGDKELVEKLGRNDPCPCGSGSRFQTVLPQIRLLLMAPSATTIGENDFYRGWLPPAPKGALAPTFGHPRAAKMTPQGRPTANDQKRTFPTSFAEPDSGRSNAVLLAQNGPTPRTQPRALGSPALLGKGADDHRCGPCVVGGRLRHYVG